MRLIMTDEDRERLNKALEGLDAKVREAFVFLRDPVSISASEMEEVISYFRLRLETLGISIFAFKAIADLLKERGFGDDKDLAAFASNPPDEFYSQLLLGGPTHQIFDRFHGRADDMTDERMAPVRERLDALSDQAVSEQLEGVKVEDSFMERYRTLLIENGLTDAARDLGDEMYGALNEIEEWFQSRLQGETVDA